MQERSIIHVSEKMTTLIVEETYDADETSTRENFRIEKLFEAFLKDGLHFSWYQAFTASMVPSGWFKTKVRMSCPVLLICETVQEAHEIRARLVEQHQGLFEVSQLFHGYRQRLKMSAVGRGKHVFQTSSGASSYGHVVLKIEPDPKLRDVVFINQVDEKTIPAIYTSALASAVREAVFRGGPSGYPLIGLNITAIDGSYHEVDSNARGFRYAAVMAMWDGMRIAGAHAIEAA